MPEPCKFPSLDSCHRKFVWAREKVDLAPHPVVGLVLQVGEAEKFYAGVNKNRNKKYALPLYIEIRLMLRITFAGSIQVTLYRLRSKL